MYSQQTYKEDIKDLFYDKVSLASHDGHIFTGISFDPKSNFVVAKTDQDEYYLGTPTILDLKTKEEQMKIMKESFPEVTFITIGTPILKVSPEEAKKSEYKEIKGINVLYMIPEEEGKFQLWKKVESAGSSTVSSVYR